MPKDDNRSARPISMGSMTLPLTNWITPAMLTTAKVMVASPISTWATKAINAVATIDPIFGMKFNTNVMIPSDVANSRLKARASTKTIAPVMAEITVFTSK